VEDSCNRKPGEKIDEDMEENQQIEANLVTESFKQMLDSDTVKKLFVTVMKPFGGADIVDIYRCSSTSMQARFELFLKQIALTEKYRGDANVRYAWLASSKGALSTIMSYGLGHCGPCTTNSKHGIGVHLSAANCCHTRLDVFPVLSKVEIVSHSLAITAVYHVFLKVKCSFTLRQ
jgi:hypothetical protein